jgi:hypothetical protein
MFLLKIEGEKHALIVSKMAPIPSAENVAPVDDNAKLSSLFSNKKKKNIKSKKITTNDLAGRPTTASSGNGNGNSPSSKPAKIPTSSPSKSPAKGPLVGTKKKFLNHIKPIFNGPNNQKSARILQR